MIFANNWHVATRPRLSRYELLAETAKRNGKESVDHVQPHLSHALAQLLYHDEEAALGKPRGRPRLLPSLARPPAKPLYTFRPGTAMTAAWEGGIMISNPQEPSRACT